MKEYPDFRTNSSACYNVPLSMQELRYALQHTKNNSPDEDTIFAVIVINCHVMPRKNL